MNDPVAAVTPHNLGIIYAYLGDYDKSLAASREVLKLNPGSGSAYVNRLSTNDLASRRTLRPGRKPGFPVGEYLC